MLYAAILFAALNDSADAAATAAGDVPSAPGFAAAASLSDGAGWARHAERIDAGVGVL